ncbi:MAG: DUF2312 domain-containing protein [Xanthomonadaceae bacterium]|nr:DUF2312 domain-containing protein [Xanthomonadaceae bacterium]
MAFAKERLKDFVERLSRLDDDAQNVRNDRKEVVAEAKAEGFDTKVLNNTVKRYRMDKGDRQEADALQELYDVVLP